MASRFVPFTMAPPQSQGVQASVVGNHHQNLQPTNVQLAIMQTQPPPMQQQQQQQHQGIHSHPHNQPPPQLQPQQQQQAVSLSGNSHMLIPPPSVGTPQPQSHHQQQQHHHQQHPHAAHQQQQQQQHKKMNSNTYQVIMSGVIQAPPPKMSSHNAQVVQPKTVPPLTPTNMPATSTSSIAYRLNQHNHNRDGLKSNGVSQLSCPVLSGLVFLLLLCSLISVTRRDESLIPTELKY